MAGALIGVVFGAVSLYLLIKFITALTGQGKIPVLMAAMRPVCIIAGLLLTAFVFPDQLIWAGIGMAAVLILGALVATVVRMKRKKAEERKEV